MQQYVKFSVVKQTDPAQAGEPQASVTIGGEDDFTLVSGAGG